MGYFLLYMLQQPAGVYNFEGEVGQWVKVYINTGCFVFNQALFVIDLQLITIVDFFESFLRFNQVKAVVDCIAIEDSGKCLCNNGLDACCANGPDGVLSG